MLFLLPQGHALTTYFYFVLSRSSSLLSLLYTESFHDTCHIVQKTTRSEPMFVVFVLFMPPVYWFSASSSVSFALMLTFLPFCPATCLSFPFGAFLTEFWMRSVVRTIDLSPFGECACVRSGTVDGCGRDCHVFCETSSDWILVFFEDTDKDGAQLLRMSM